MDFAVTYDNTVLNVDSVKIGKSADVDVSGDSTAADAPVFNTNQGQRDHCQLVYCAGFCILDR